MVTINGNRYRLALLDSNVASMMVRSPKREMKSFLGRFFTASVIPAFSPFTIVEISQRAEILERLADWFSVIPCVILKSHEQLLSDEVEFYPNPSRVCPILVASSSRAIPGALTLDKLLSTFLEDEPNIANMRRWLAGRDDALDGMISLKPNFPSQGGRYPRERVREFVEIVVVEQLGLRQMSFARRVVEKERRPIDIDAFPSVKMGAYAVFYKRYVPGRKPERSDVFDILISTSFPYVDLVCTDRHQVEVLRRTKARDDFLAHVEAHTLKALRS